MKLFSFSGYGAARTTQLEDRVRELVSRNLEISKLNVELTRANVDLSKEVIRLSQRAAPVIDDETDYDDPPTRTEVDRIAARRPEQGQMPAAGDRQ